MAWWVWALRLTGLGWYVAFCIIAGIVGGLWLDRWLGTRILFTLVGVVLGSAVAVYGLYRLVAPIMKESQSEGKSSRKERGR